MSVWINGRPGSRVDSRDRGLQYGDGLFETMLVRRRGVRLLDYHLDRLYASCERLRIEPPARERLCHELQRMASRRSAGILKLILTRGRGERGYRPTGAERCTRVVTLAALPKSSLAAGAGALELRLCTTRLGANDALAGMKTLNRLESVLARMEWTDPGIREGLMLDQEDRITCGTMSNVFIRCGTRLATPLLDRCGVAGVMRRWVMESAGGLGLEVTERRLRWADLQRADEVFVTNAVAGVMPVGAIRNGAQRLRFKAHGAAADLAARLASL